MWILAIIGLATSSCRKSLGISPALMRLFPNLFLWYFGTIKQYLFILICTGRHDVPFSWNRIAQNMAAMAKICNPVLRERIHFFKWKFEWYLAISYAIQNTFLTIFKQITLLSCGIVCRFPTSGQLCAISLFFDISSRNSTDSCLFYQNSYL